MVETSERQPSDPLAEPPVAMGHLPELLGYALRRAQVTVFADFHHRFSADDITPAQFGVLEVLKHNPGLRQTQVSAALGVRRTNFVPLFDGLEARGLAERRKVPADRRAFALYLTPAGEDLLERLERTVSEHEAKFTARIGAEGKHQLLTLLHRLCDPSHG
jgi:DNA-binding MarR family transcriptional regulator